MANETINLRQQRGLQLAATARILQKGQSFTVPSQSSKGSYVVIKARDEFHCTCPDYEERGQTCKHGFAVEYYLRRETAPDGTVTETRASRVTYSQNWAAYNRAQVSEKDQFCALLKDLVSTVESPEQKRGRPALPLADMIFAAAFKTYSTVSARRFMTDLRTAANAGLIARAPHYNSIFNCLSNENLTPVLKDLIMRSALPLSALETQFAVDSTGFGTQCFYRHYASKYGREQYSRDYLKLHALIGAKTNVVACADVTDRDTHDTTMLPGLVTTAAPHFAMAELSADKAYSSRKNLELIESVGAVPFVPFKSNAQESAASPVWNRLFHFFQFHRDQFLPRYHARSNAESTFSAMKRKFRATLRSKTVVAQRNELLLTVLCHNLVCVIHELHESGIDAVFPLLTGCPINHGAAQEHGGLA